MYVYPVYPQALSFTTSPSPYLPHGHEYVSRTFNLDWSFGLCLTNKPERSSQTRLGVPHTSLPSQLSSPVVLAKWIPSIPSHLLSINLHQNVLAAYLAFFQQLGFYNLFNCWNALIFTPRAFSPPAEFLTGDFLTMQVLYVSLVTTLVGLRLPQLLSSPSAFHCHSLFLFSTNTTAWFHSLTFTPVCTRTIVVGGAQSILFAVLFLLPSTRALPRMTLRPVIWQWFYFA